MSCFNLFFQHYCNDDFLLETISANGQENDKNDKNKGDCQHDGEKCNE